MPVRRIQILLEEDDFQRSQAAKNHLAVVLGTSVTWLDLLMFAVDRNEPA